MALLAPWQSPVSRTSPAAVRPSKMNEPGTPPAVPALPPGWHGWEGVALWYARKPNGIDPPIVVRAATREALVAAVQAWEAAQARRWAA